MIELIKNNQIVKFMIATTLPLAMISGLFMAPWIGVMMFLLLISMIISHGKKITTISYPEIAIIIWASLSCFWSINTSSSFVVASELILLLPLVSFIRNNANFINIKADEIYRLMIIGLCCAIAILFIERDSNGIIFFITRKIFQPHSKNIFALYWLDRGCAILSIATWPIIAYLVSCSRYLKALVIYIMVFITLFYSDSTASFFGFILAGITYLLMVFTRLKLWSLIAASLVIYVVAMPVFSILQTPDLLIGKYSTIPNSFAHRLFIWKFVAEKAIEHPINGIGIGATKFVEVLDSDIVNYKNIEMSPLPSHPHNNILQIWLETGIIGLVLAGIYIWWILSKIRNTQENNSWIASSYASFINYFFIGMVSFNIWQTWWLMSAVFLVMLMNANRSSHHEHK